MKSELDNQVDQKKKRKEQEVKEESNFVKL